MALTPQIETATIVGTVTLTGTALITITAAGMNNSPKTISVNVTNGDNASAVAAKAIAVLALDPDVTTLFLVGGTGANVSLTDHVPNANDPTLNIASTNGTCTGLTAQPTSTHTQAGTGILNGYCTLADMRSSPVLAWPAADTTLDQFFCNIINAVSRAIDQNTNRTFYQSAAHEVRYFTPESDERCFVGDVVSVVSLITDSSNGDRSYPFTWAITDYDLWPYDAPNNSEPEPYRYIEKAPTGHYRFPYGFTRLGYSHGEGTPKGVKLDAVFGWPEIPALISQACLLWSERVFKRYATPLGVSSTTAFGTQTVKVPPPDPDVAMMINNYALLGV